MPDVISPTYRFRGNIKPSAEVSRPVAAYRNATGTGTAGSGGTATSATLDIFDVIDSWGGFWGVSADDVDAALKKIGAVDTLYVRLNSPGGEATEGVAIANLLRAHKATVRVTVYGIAASAASYIAIAGDTVNMGPGSLMFVHDAWDIALGDAADLRKVADTLDTISDSIAGLYVLKAGGTTEQWRGAMHEDTWYSAEAAVAAKLADQVGLDPQLPADLPPVEDDAEDDATVIEIDIEVSPAARAAARRFDLSMLPNAPAALAPKTPADQPVTPPTDHKEADTMSDTIPTAGLVKALGLPDDADEDAILEEVEANAATAAAAASKPAEKPAEPVIPDGKVLVSQNVLDELKTMAQSGVEARAKQLAEERDEHIVAAFRAGKISAERKEAWTASWDKDPEGTKADLDSLPARFPVAKVEGYQGHDDSVGDSAKPFSDEEADQLGALAGLPKGVLR